MRLGLSKTIDLINDGAENVDLSSKKFDLIFTFHRIIPWRYTQKTINLGKNIKVK